MAEPVSTTVALFVKKVVIDIGVKMLTKPAETASKLVKVLAICITPPILVGMLVCGFITKMPSFFVIGLGAENDKVTQSTIQEYVKLENEIESIARARCIQIAQDKINSIKEKFAESAFTPTPDPTWFYNPYISFSPSPTNTPAPLLKFNQNIEVTTPTWRVLLALATVYNAQDFTVSSKNYLKGLVSKNITYDIDVQQVKFDNVITYTLTVDTSCIDVLELAKLVKSKNTKLNDDEKSGLADGYYDFLCYFDNKGNRLDHPYYDISLGADLSAEYPIITNSYCVAMPYFNQGDRKWNYDAQGNPLILYEPDRTVRSSGCGPTSMSMVIWAFTADKDPTVKANVNPVSVFNYAIKHGYYKGTGAYPSLFSSIGKKYGITVKFWTPTAQRIVDALQKGHRNCARGS